MTRPPLDTLVVALLDAAAGAGILALALTHDGHRDVLVHFGVYFAVIGFFKIRAAIPRVPALVAAARAGSTGFARPPLRLRAVRLAVGYDTWSHTERFGIVVICALVCILFGWDDGGPFAAAILLALGVVNGVLALVALAAQLDARARRERSA